MKRHLLVAMIAVLMMATSVKPVSAAFVVKSEMTTLASSDAMAEHSAKAEITASKEEIAKGDDSQPLDNTTRWIATGLALFSILVFPLGLARFYLGKKHAKTQLFLIFPGILLILPALASWVWQVADFFRLLFNGRL